MSDYKRLTTKDKDGNYQVWEDDFSHPFEALQTAIDKLAELENKIEKGAFIELPCTVGDWLYYLNNNAIHKAKVKEIKYSISSHAQDGEDLTIYAYDLKNKLELSFYHKQGYSVAWENNNFTFLCTFLTEAEAEASLLTES